MGALGRLSTQQFLRRYWQKKPYLVRGAFPEFKNFLDRSQAEALACAEDIESRLIVRNGRKWLVEHGPFKRSDFRKLPRANWTLLIHGLNLHLAEADALLRRFDFIPAFRLDDVMGSYAAGGGGVGPHYDSYDVFLLQGKGTRLWQLGSLRDDALQTGAPLKLLENFVPEREYLLEPGDMLYLPPRIAHNGVAREECVTYSIGFRAPTAQELGARFLNYLEDQLALAGEYRDPELKTQRQPAKISDAALAKAARLLAKIKWNGRDIEQFFGRYLTEPKPHVFFSPPRVPLTRAEFRARCQRSGVKLDLKTQMLYRRRNIFINGDAAQTRKALVALANERRLPARAALAKESGEVLYSWYLAGYLHIDT